MVQIKLLETSYKYHHKDPEKIEQFYQYIYDLCDYKSLELVLDHIWPLEKRLHENNELEAVKFIRKHFKGLFHLKSYKIGQSYIKSYGAMKQLQTKLIYTIALFTLSSLFVWS